MSDAATRRREGGAAVQQWLVEHLPARLVYAAAEHLHARQEPELVRAEELVDRDKVAVDIGGWLGPWTRALARLVPEVHTFEPQERLARHLARVVPHNVVLHRAAVGDHAGTAYLRVESGPGQEALGRVVDDADEEHIERVPMVTLDEVGLVNVGFIKIDVEGNELAVLRGGEALLMRDAPRLLVEIEQRHLDVPITDVFEWLEVRGWSGSFLRNGHWEGIGSFAVDRDQTPYLNQLPHPAYVNNFRFDRRDSSRSGS